MCYIIIFLFFKKELIILKKIKKKLKIFGVALPFGGHPQLRAFRHKKTVVGGREAETYGFDFPKHWASVVYKKNEKLVLHLQPLRTSFKGNGKTCEKVLLKRQETRCPGPYMTMNSEILLLSVFIA